MAELTDDQKNDLREQVKAIAGVTTSDYDTTLDSILPLMLDDAEDYCNRSFDPANLPAGVVLYLAEAFQADVRDTGIKSKKMGNVTITYTSTEEASAQTMNRLRKYRKVRFTS